MALKLKVVADRPGIAQVSLVGSLDSDTAPELEKSLAAIDARVLLVVLDMKDLTFISSAGLRVIFAALKRQQSKGGEVVLSNMSPGVKKVFEIVKALPTMSVFASVEEMDDYLAHFQKRQS
jgi:anti-anti-sigma factor